MTSGPEQQWIAQAQRGDHAALGRLLQKHQQRVYNVCLRMVSHPDDAAEVAQDAMLKAVEHIGSFQARARFSTWLIRIAMNQAVSHLRRRRLRRTTSLDQPAGPGPAAYTGGWAGSSGGGPSGNSSGGGGNSGGGGDQAAALRHQLADHREPSPEQRVQTREALERLEAALAALDPDFRAVIVLRDLEQMDYQEIADTLQVALGTVKSRLFRARLALREIMLRPEFPKPCDPVEHPGPQADQP